MPAFGFQTPPLDQWMRAAEPSLERCRRECKGNDQPARLGALTTWAQWADAELGQLRALLAQVEAERDALAADLAALRALVASADAEDAETARALREPWFADAWDLADLPPALVGRHVHG